MQERAELMESCVDRNPEDNELAYFLLQQNQTKFIISLSDVLRCLKFAEEKWIVPCLTDDWWNDMRVFCPELFELVKVPDDDEENGLGETVRTYRKMRKMTQEELAKLADVSVNTIYNLENGIGDVRFSTVSAVGRVLQIPGDELMYGCTKQSGNAFLTKFEQFNEEDKSFIEEIYKKTKLVAGYVDENPEDDELAYFILKNGKTEFIIALSDVLRCLKFSEENGIVSKFPDGWWINMHVFYPTLY